MSCFKKISRKIGHRIGLTIARVGLWVIHSVKRNAAFNIAMLRLLAKVVCSDSSITHSLAR